MNKDNKRFLQYQQEAIDYAINHLLKNNEFNLQAPTGSGKTYILANLISHIIENEFLNINPITFVFISPSTGKIDYQNYEKIKKYLNKEWVGGYYVKYIGNDDTKKSKSFCYLDNINYFQQNHVYFFGWNMLSAGTKITEMDSEYNNIFRVIQNTNNKNIKIILIIDEAHINHQKKNEKIKSDILSMLNPYKTIRVSATLEQSNIKSDYEISYDSVIEECAIKKNVEINSTNRNITFIDKLNENEQLIITAIEHQKKVKKEYYKKNININPLILIQIPNKVVIDDEINTEDLLLENITNFLENKGYTKEINYAIWLDKIKTNTKDEIERIDSQIEILIFKQSISVGWDVPRQIS